MSTWAARKMAGKRVEKARARGAARYASIVKGADRRVLAPPSGPTSYPVKKHDEATQALIDEALRERGLA